MIHLFLLGACTSHTLCIWHNSKAHIHLDDLDIIWVYLSLPLFPDAGYFCMKESPEPQCKLILDPKFYYKQLQWVCIHLLIIHLGVFETSLQSGQDELGDEEEVLSDSNGENDHEPHDPLT